jgi:hypothetical protein
VSRTHMTVTSSQKSRKTDKIVVCVRKSKEEGDYPSSALFPVIHLIVFSHNFKYVVAKIHILQRARLMTSIFAVLATIDQKLAFTEFLQM